MRKLDIEVWQDPDNDWCLLTLYRDPVDGEILFETLNYNISKTNLL